jgi:hypothetical protein
MYAALLKKCFTVQTKIVISVPMHIHKLMLNDFKKLSTIRNLWTEIFLQTVQRHKLSRNT